MLFSITILHIHDIICIFQNYYLGLFPNVCKTLNVKVVDLFNKQPTGDGE